jgi:hypothetical protein
MFFFRQNHIEAENAGVSTHIRPCNNKKIFGGRVLSLVLCIYLSVATSIYVNRKSWLFAKTFFFRIRFTFYILQSYHVKRETWRLRKLSSVRVWTTDSSCIGNIVIHVLHHPPSVNPEFFVLVLAVECARVIRYGQMRLVVFSALVFMNIMRPW